MDQKTSCSSKPKSNQKNQKIKKHNEIKKLNIFPPMQED